MGDLAFDARELRATPRGLGSGWLILAILVAGMMMTADFSEVFAQASASGTLQGLVTDPTGAVIPEAAVTIMATETGTSLSTKTGPTGRYFAPNLAVGQYKITVSHPGFKTLQRTGVILQINQTAEVDVTLEVGTTSQQVTVAGAAPLIATSNATIGQVITNKEILDLPLNGRSYAQLAYLTPTVVPGRGCCPSSFTPTFSTPTDFSIGGSRGEDNQFTVDGLSTTNDFVGGSYIYPSIDGIQEFKIVQNTYLPNLGSRVGQVLLISKAGTNQFHGDAYEFLRNSALDARNTFDITKFPLHQNQFGATLGGPVIRNKTFFFFGYEGTRIRQGTTETTIQPSAAMRAGDFAALLPTVQLVAPVDYPAAGLKAGEPIPGNDLAAIPGAINRISATIIAKTGYPLPNGPGDTYTVNPSVPTDENYYQGRVDQYLSERDRLWGSYFYEGFNSTTEPFTTLPSEKPVTTNNAQQVGLTWDHTVSSNTLNNFVIGYNQNIPFITNGALPSLTGVTQQDLGFPLNSFQPVLGQRGITAGIPNFGITGYGDTGASGSSGPQLYRTIHMELSDDLSVVHGRHFLEFGVDFLRDHQDQRFDPEARGLYGFSGQYTGNGFADFLLGFPTSTNREINFTGQTIFESLDREMQYSGFAQDTFHITPSFTLNYGLRYDFFGPPKEKYGRLANFIPRGNQIVRVEGTGGHGGSLSPSGSSLGTQGFDIGIGCLCTKTKGDFSPRLSFAWRPFGSQHTVVRAGAGRFYSRVTYNEQQSIRFNPPWVFRQAFTNAAPVQLGGPGPSFDVTDGFETGLVPQSYGGFATDPNLKDMVVQQWSLQVEQQLTKSMMASLSYVGSQMYHGDNNPPLNQAVPGPGPLEPRRPWHGFISPQSDPFPPVPQFLVYSYGTFGASASYNALTGLIKKQFSQDLTFLASFTWMKSLDTSSSIIGAVQNPYDLAADHGLSAFDVPKRFVASWIYDLPFGQGKRFLSSKGILSDILGGWNITGILGAEDGYYVNPTVSANLVNSDGFTTLRPDRTCSGSLAVRTRQEWFDTACFTLPAPYTWGTAGRDTIEAPGDFTFDTSVIKDFHIKENQRLEFRSEFFDVLNHTNLGAPVVDASSPSLGQIFSTNPSALPGSREIQFALKYFF